MVDGFGKRAAMGVVWGVCPQFCFLFFAPFPSTLCKRNRRFCLALEEVDSLPFSTVP